MPFKSTEKPQHDLVITRPHGRITNDELPAYYEERLQAGTLHPGMRELVDGRSIEVFEVDARGQGALVKLLKEHRDRLEGIRWAFIAPNQLAFGMFRMFEAQKSDLPFETAVFRSADDAAEWLGVPPEALAAGD